MDTLEIGRLRSFLAVVETGGFTEAGARVHRSQSAVSMQIRKLEQTVGGRLFERRGAGIRLTERGEMLLSHARRILDEHDAALSELRRAELDGTVRIGVMEDYAAQILPTMLARFGRRHRHVRLAVTAGVTAELLRGLGGAFDLVLATQVADLGSGTVLRREQIRWAFAAHLPLPSFDPVPLAVMPPGNLFRGWAIAALEAAGIDWRIAYTSSSIAAIEAAAEAGIAITVAKRGTARPGLRLLGPESGLPPLPGADIALHRAPAATAPAVLRLAEHLADELRGLP